MAGPRTTYRNDDADRSPLFPTVAAIAQLILPSPYPPGGSMDRLHRVLWSTPEQLLPALIRRPGDRWTLTLEILLRLSQPARLPGRDVPVLITILSTARHAIRRDPVGSLCLDQEITQLLDLIAWNPECLEGTFIWGHKTGAKLASIPRLDRKLCFRILKKALAADARSHPTPHQMLDVASLKGDALPSDDQIIFTKAVPIKELRPRTPAKAKNPAKASPALPPRPVPAPRTKDAGKKTPMRKRKTVAKTTADNI